MTVRVNNNSSGVKYRMKTEDPNPKSRVMVMEVEEEEEEVYRGKCTQCSFASDYDSVFRHGVEQHGIYICVCCSIHYTYPKELMVHLHREHGLPPQKFKSQQEFIQGGGEETVLCCVDCSKIFDLSDNSYYELVDGHECCPPPQLRMATFPKGKRKGMVFPLESGKGRGRKEEIVEQRVVSHRHEEGSKVNGVNGVNGHWEEEHSVVMGQPPISPGVGGRPRRALKKIMNDDFIFEHVGKKKSRGQRSSISGAQNVTISSHKRIVMKMEFDKTRNDKATPSPKLPHLKIKLENGYHHAYTPAFADLEDKKELKHVIKGEIADEIEEEEMTPKIDPVLLEPDPEKRLLMLIQELCDKLSQDWPRRGMPGYTSQEPDDSKYDLVVNKPLDETVAEDMLTQMLNKTMLNCTYCRQVKLIRIDKRQLAIHLFSKHFWTVKLVANSNEASCVTKSSSVEGGDQKPAISDNSMSSDSSFREAQSSQELRSSISDKQVTLPSPSSPTAEQRILNGPSGLSPSEESGFQEDFGTPTQIHPDGPFQKILESESEHSVTPETPNVMPLSPLKPDGLHSEPVNIATKEESTNLPTQRSIQPSSCENLHTLVPYQRIEKAVSSNDGSTFTLMDWKEFKLAILTKIFKSTKVVYTFHDKDLLPFGEAPCECLLCGYSVDHQKNLFLHWRKIHRGIAMRCAMCQGRFLFAGALFSHLCFGTPYAVIKNEADCRIPPSCGGKDSPSKTFADGGQIQILDAKHDDGSPNTIVLRYQCSICENVQLPGFFNYVVHLRKYHNRCELCLEVLSSQKELEHHMKKHKLNHFCWKCGVTYCAKPNFMTHLFWKHGSESKECRKCLKKKWPHIFHFCVPPLVFVCESCGFYFTKAKSLIVHRRMHTGEKMISCSKAGCTERFVSKRLLQKHMDSAHSPDKPLHVQKSPVAIEGIAEKHEQDPTRAEEPVTIKSELTEEVKEEASVPEPEQMKEEEHSVEPNHNKADDAVVEEQRNDIKECRSGSVSPLQTSSESTTNIDEKMDIEAEVSHIPNAVDATATGTTDFVVVTPMGEESTVNNDKPDETINEQDTPVVEPKMDGSDPALEIPGTLTPDLPKEEDNTDQQTDQETHPNELDDDPSKRFSLETIQGPNLSEDESHSDSDSLDVFDTLGASVEEMKDSEDFGPIPMSPLLPPLDDFNLNLNVPDIPTFEDNSLPEHIIRENAIFSLRNEHDYCLRTTLKRSMTSPRKEKHRKMKMMRMKAGRKRHHSSSSSSCSSCDSNCSCSGSSSSSSGNSSSDEESTPIPAPTPVRIHRGPGRPPKNAVIFKRPVNPPPIGPDGLPIKRGRGRPKGSVNRNKDGIPTAKKKYSTSSRRIGRIATEKAPRPMNPDGTPMRRKYRKLKGKFSKRPSTTHYYVTECEENSLLSFPQENFLPESDLETEDSGSEETYDYKQLCESIGKVPAFDEIWTMSNDQYLLKILRAVKNVRKAVPV